MGAENDAWPDSLPVAQVRIARQTDQLDEVVRFYVEGLGLRELLRFGKHEGYDGVLLGLPGTGYHLEFITHEDGSPGAAPTAENLLVLYFTSATQVAEVAERLTAFGVDPVEAANPYWTRNGALTFPDPDGWRVVLMPRTIF
ncbi:VOC family protein [Nocardia sp. NPDC049149]|uniref:VOC family protein n=1 Tax=Nocardia sp. NPDC049149 TaxID=3364315 RepID=UPI00371F46F7